MYLRLEKKIAPVNVALMIDANLSDSEVDWDYENVYEWVYLEVPNSKLTLNISRDHGQHVIDDDVLDGMSDEELRALPQAGKTYIMREESKWISFDLIKFIAEKTNSAIDVFDEMMNVDKEDGDPLSRIEPAEQDSTHQSTTAP